MRSVMAVMVAAALSVAACSSKAQPNESTSPAPARPSTSSAPETPTQSTPATPEAHGSLAECLQANGVQDAGGQAVLLGPPSGVDPGTWDSAMRACSSLAPGPGPG